jgi:hypothetical protein
MTFCGRYPNGGCPGERGSERGHARQFTIISGAARIWNR